MRLLLAGLLSAGLVIGSAKASVSSDDVFEIPQGSNSTIPDLEEKPEAAGLIVEIAKPELSESSIAAIESKADVEVVDVTDYADDVQVIDFAEQVDAETVEDAVAAAEARSDVISAEPNWIAKHTGLPGSDQSLWDAWTGDDSRTYNLVNGNGEVLDTTKILQYGLWDSRKPTGGFSIKAPMLWRYTSGADRVTVAVIDTGILGNHPDLSGRLVSGYDFISTPISSRDSDGWDSDPTDEGDWTVSDWSSWHGTGVASLISAIADSKGIVGVAPGARILPIRVLGSGGGLESDIAAGIRWAAGFEIQGEDGQSLINPNPAQVINLSLGRSGSCGPTYQDAINDARARGVVVIAARGNSNSDGASAPASCEGVIGVAASNENGGRASYSNYGEETDLAAPGGDGDDNVWVATNTGNKNANNQPTGFVWTPSQGTSLAAPLVSGAAALMFSLGYVASDIEKAFGEGSPATAIQSSPACNGCGDGILDLSKIISPVRATSDARITGSTTVGSTLSAYSSWVGEPELAYQWYRSGQLITGATGATYKLQRTDISHPISVKITASKTVIATGLIQNVASLSALTAKVNPPPTAVSGTMKSGQYVTWGSSSLKSLWPASGTGYSFKYQWYNNGKAISKKYGGQSYRYKLRSSDRGDRIRVKVSITKSGYAFTSTSADRKVAR